MTTLPIEAVRGDFLDAFEGGPVVLSAPTGSGKSTAVPRWCPGRVLVVEPRRVACQSLARRVAELEGVTLGHEVGFHVRDNKQARADTRILFVTPGMALRMLDRVAGYDAVILDELHERSLETDLLLALLRGRAKGLVAMSATLEADRVATYLGARHVEGHSRTYPVDIRYSAGGVLLPDREQLPSRVADAVAATADLPGDVLVFLPGKGEIAAVRDALHGKDHVVELHGGLSLDQQGKAFSPAPRGRRKVVLATNVAETSVTIVGIGVVIDSGLVRRTHFHRDRGYLTVSPIALDSADQRAGRAGRTGPGVCIRLFSEAARLESVTPPAIHREALTPLVLSAAVAGADARSIEFLDAPKEYALDAAFAELSVLGGLDEEGRITDRGRAMFGLPLDAALGRLLIEAERTSCLDDAIDLVATLALQRPLFERARPVHEEDDLRSCGCDAVAAIRAVRMGDARRHALSAFALREARANAKRLHRAFGTKPPADADARIDRRRLAETAMAADPRMVHVARRRKRRVAWSNGGTEIELGRESAAQGRLSEEKKDEVEAIVVLGTHALGLGRRDAKVLATSVMPVPLPWLVGAGLGRDRLAGVTYEKRKIQVRIERVYAKKVIDTREDVPHGAMAREAIRDLVLRGKLFKKARAISAERIVATALAGHLGLSVGGTASTDYSEWLLEHLEGLGVEASGDLALLSLDDVTFPDVPFEVRHVLDQEYPREVTTGDATYRVEYDVPKRRVLLHMFKGTRKKPPPRSWLPRFEGFRITIEAGGTMHALR